MPFILYLAFLLVGKVFALIVGFFYIKYLPKPYKIVLSLIAIAFFCESYGYYIQHFLKHYNAWLFNLYILVETWLMGAAAIYLVENMKLKKIFFTLLVVNSLIWTFNILNNSIYIFANVSTACGLAVLTIIYVILLINNGIFSSKHLLKQPLFWLAISTIVYCACNVPYMSLRHYLSISVPAIYRDLDYINSVLDIIRYPLVAISFILLGSKQDKLVKATQHASR